MNMCGLFYATVNFFIAIVPSLFFFIVKTIPMSLVPMPMAQAPPSMHVAKLDILNGTRRESTVTTTTAAAKKKNPS